MQAFFNPPRELSEPEIENIIERFANTAVIAEKAGFSGVQIHAAHGYLLSQFLSPHHNRRTDKWSGSLENRLRIILAILHKMRERTSAHFLIGIKLNSADFQKGGFSEEESVQAVKILSDEKIDFIKISGGNYESPTMLDGVKESTKQREAYFLDYAEKVRAVSDVPLIITGGFRSSSTMEQALQSGDLDFVGLAKPFALMPDLPKQILANTYQTIATPSPRLGLKAVDKSLGSMIEMNWYMHQMRLIGQGQKPKPNYAPWKVFAKMLLAQGKGAFRRERA